jgi:hypothetical protein
MDLEILEGILEENTVSAGFLHFTTLVALLQGSNANNRYHPLPVQICPGIRTQSDPIVPN